MLAWKKLMGIALLFLLMVLVAFGFTPALAQTPSATVTKTATAVNSNTVVTATATLTPTATTVPATATKTLVPPTATKTKTVAPSATATKTMVPPTATVTKTVAPSATATKPAATATVTKTATATPTKTKTPVPPTATLTRAAAPRAGVVSALSTMIVAQNMDSTTTANLTATFYDAAGATVSTVNKTVSPYRHTTIDQRASGGGLDSFTNWQGSVVLSSNTQLAAVVNEYSGSAASLGVDFRADAYNGVPSTQASTSVLLPQVLKSIYDSAQQKTYTSKIAIQNTSATASANVTITYTSLYPQTGAYTRTGIVIPPGAATHVDMASETPWSQFFGPATVTSNQNIAVIVNQNAAGSLLIYRGFTSAEGGTSLLVTQALTNIFDSGQQLNYGSAVEGMTVDGSSTTVTVNYTNLLGGTKSCTLPAGSTFRVDMRPGNWPVSCTPPVNGAGQFFGSITFTADRPIVALSNLQSDYSAAKGIRTSTSRAFVTAGGATTGYAPLVMNGYLDVGTGVTWGTALEGRFLSGTGTATITYYLPSGTTYTDTYTAGTDQIFRFDQRLQNPQTGFSLPNGTIAAAVVTASQPFVFTVNAQGTSSTLGDALTVYMSQ